MTIPNCKMVLNQDSGLKVGNQTTYRDLFQPQEERFSLWRQIWTRVCLPEVSA